MSMSVSLLVAAEGEQQLRELPMPAYAYGLIALGAFALLLAITWAFRGTARKIATGQHHSVAGHDDHGGSGRGTSSGTSAGSGHH